MPSEDVIKNYSLSIRSSIMEYVEENRVGKFGYNNRSDYIQKLILKDITRGKFDMFVELMSMLILPMMFFGFFMICAVLTKGTLFFLFMGISGLVAIAFGMIYYRKQKSME